MVEKKSDERTHPISVAIYRRQIRLNRYLNDAWILRPSYVRNSMSKRKC